MALFHREVGFPVGLTMPVPGLRLTYSKHARYAARVDGRERFLPTELPVVFQVVEAETECGVVLKWVVRVNMPYDPHYDLVLVINPDGYVRTVWSNHRDDTHVTLNVNRYTAPDLHEKKAEV